MECQSDAWISGLHGSLEQQLERKKRFMELAERNKPVLFCEMGDERKPYWAMPSYDTVMAVGTQNDIFSNRHGILLGRYENAGSKATPEKQRATMPFTGSILAMDGQEHHQVRGIVGAAFTPKAIRDLYDTIENVVQTTAKHVASQYKGQTVDFRDVFANKIPATITCEMMGIPKDQQSWITDETVVLMQEAHPSHDDGDIKKWIRTSRKLYKFALELGEEKKAKPTDDLTSIMLEAKVDGRHLTLDEYADFFVLLAVSGIESTAGVIAAAFHYLYAHPEQKQDLEDNFDEVADSAVEELVRVHTPIMHFTRRAVSDTNINGVDIASGDKVCMYYIGANVDPNVFYDPLTFDIRRPTKPKHLAFGAPNPHYCLGANLSRAEIKAALKAIIEYFPSYKPVYDGMRYCPSRWGNGWRKMPISLP